MVTDRPASGEVGPRPRSSIEPNVLLEASTARPEVEPQTAVSNAVASDPNLTSAAHLQGLSADEIETIDANFQRLLETVHANRPGDDLEVIRSAWAFSLQQHEGQKRASGEPYIIHPLEVGQVLAELKMDSTAIAAGLLHDAVEETSVST